MTGEFEARKSIATEKQIHRAWARELKVCVPAILEEIDGNGRGRVVALYDGDFEADNVPILSLYTGDGYGEEHAHHLPERGFLLCADYPMIDILEATDVTEGISQRREHVFQDGMFFPGAWWDDQTPPGSPPGEYRYTHESGATRRVTTDGTIEDTATSGATVRNDEVGVHAEYGGHTVEVTETEVSVSFERTDGLTVDVDVTADGATISVPDEYNDQATDPRSEVGVSADGTASVDGRAAVGDTDAYREDRLTLNSDPDDPRTYEETTEPIAPILDPTDDVETVYDNPATTSFQGPTDHALYESRRFVVERREADPDPLITDETDPAYIDLPQAYRDAGVLPTGLVWQNTTDDMLRRVGNDGLIIDLG